MCGIAGVWHPVGDLDSTIRGMTAKMRHRGPDGSGHEILADEGLALGHRRLAIVDLSPTGAQPMYSATGRYCLTFNGEVYNFRELRSHLLSRGHVFRGSSDSEVMLACFEAVGVEAALRQFHGMFGFALWDKQERALWLARDRMGEKPVYYGQFGSTFAFASELKSLRGLANCPHRVNADAVADVLERGFVRGSRTVLEGVSKLLPGHSLRVDRRGAELRMEARRYWSVQTTLDEVQISAPQDAWSDEVAADALDELLKAVIRDEMLADVPIGAFLSGGVDSSLVVAVMQHVATEPVRTFTVGFEEGEFDEKSHAASVAKHIGTRHTTIELRADDAISYIDRLPAVFDEPFADSSQLPTLLVCQATREHVTVALSGDGGDELFGGYSQYLGRDSIGRLTNAIPRVARGPVGGLLSLLPLGTWNSLASGGTWSPNSRARLLRTLREDSARTTFEGLVSEWADPNMLLAKHRRRTTSDLLSVEWPLARSLSVAQMAYDMQTYLPDDILVKVDRCAMAVSLETRAPLLDHRIVEFALREPLARKIGEGKGKLLLRRLLNRYVPATLWDRPKKGFAIPLPEWLRGRLRPWAEAQLRDDEILRDWFDSKTIQRVWQEHQSGFDHAERLWRVLLLLQWLRHERAAP
jgi:asparagine synthase (glutamine-hydrolysing)